MAVKFELVRLKPGTTVQRVGRPAVRLFVVVSGALEKTVQGMVLKLLHTKEVFGDILSIDYKAKTISEVCQLLAPHDVRNYQSEN